jgi:hypothetical protein
MADQDNADVELVRLLQVAGDRTLVRVEIPAPQAAIWPWQVPQVPTITSDHAPNTKNGS